MNRKTKLHQKSLGFTFLPLLFVFGLTFLLQNCRKPEEFPPVPHIEFVSFTKIPTANGIDNKGLLTIFFTDGDGDMGLSESDTLSPFDPESEFHYNFFIHYFEKKNGTFEKIDLPFTLNSRIPILNTSKNNRPLKGEIEIELFINNILSPYDTIRFECQICDRALNKSNIITTPEIVIKKQ